VLDKHLHGDRLLNILEGTNLKFMHQKFPNKRGATNLFLLNFPFAAKQYCLINFFAFFRLCQ